MDSERRKYMRFDAPLDGEFHVQNSHIDGMFNARDFSRGGMRAVLNRQVDVQTQLEFDMRFPESIMVFSCLGRVVWVQENANDLSSGYNVGVEFEEIDPLERQHIVEYCYDNWNKTKNNTKPPAELEL
ncbi:MAG: PilZ domain-containing protein [Candidatus Omnitrophica bacterium]|nr:PilZ domain-containing protein [Candidatus Omnitrophota bacterium]MBU1924287.1 PilZ domain-containing protein [Candidatus Omnitrophota bacterium]